MILAAVGHPWYITRASIATKLHRVIDASVRSEQGRAMSESVIPDDGNGWPRCAAHASKQASHPSALRK